MGNWSWTPVTTVQFLPKLAETLLYMGTPGELIAWESFSISLGWLRKANVSSLVVQSVKNPPAMQEIRVQSLGWEDSLEKEVATHSSILAWKIPWTEEPGWLQSMGSQELDMIEWLNHHQEITIMFLNLQVVLRTLIKIRSYFHIMTVNKMLFLRVLCFYIFKYLFIWLHGLWDLSSLTGDQNQASSIGSVES